MFEGVLTRVHNDVGASVCIYLCQLREAQVVAYAHGYCTMHGVNYCASRSRSQGFGFLECHFPGNINIEEVNLRRNLMCAHHIDQLCDSHALLRDTFKLVSAHLTMFCKQVSFLTVNQTSVEEFAI